MKLLHIFDLLKKGWFSLPFPTPKNTYRGLILSMSLLHLFDLLKKGYFSLPFLAIIALLFFLHNLSFFCIQNNASLSLYGLRQRDNTNLSCKHSAALQIFFVFFLHSLLHLTPCPIDLSLNIVIFSHFCYNKTN